jgi:hypothetical protein
MCRVGIIVGLLFVPTNALEASPRRFSVGMEATVSGSFFDGTALPLLGVRCTAAPLRQLELFWTARVGGLGGVRDKLQVDVFAGISHVASWGRLRWINGAGVGFSTLRVRVDEQTVWGDALLCYLQSAVSFAVARGYALRLTPVAAALYNSRFWVVAWEPSFSVDVRF